jgi:hypothetical protein
LEATTFATDPTEPTRFPMNAAATMVRAAMNSNAVVYRRTWPTLDAIETLAEAEYDPSLRFNGFMDSTLDLRDGLSVVEVFAPIDDTAAFHEYASLRR